jgi:hypothetical protein
MNIPVDFENAKLLKDVGFSAPTVNAYIGGILFTNKVDVSNCDFSGYVKSVEIYEFPENWNKPDWVFTKNGSECFGCKLDNIKYFEACSAPTLTEVVVWLYKEHKIWVGVHVTNDLQMFWYEAKGKNGFWRMGVNEESSDNAYQKGIRQSLKHILKHNPK